MDTKKPVIFLSASMPTKERDHRFFDTADFIAIRDAVVALVNAIIPNFRLVWGGHPAITPIIHDIFKKRGFDYNKYVTIYQSAYFAGNMPKENQHLPPFGMPLNDIKGKYFKYISSLFSKTECILYISLLVCNFILYFILRNM